MKSKSQLLTSACIAALVFCGPALAFAAPKTSPSPSPGGSAATSPSPAAKAPRAIPFRGTATAVDQSAKSFTIASNVSARVFKVTEKTTVTKAGSAATLADLADNDAVTGSYWKQGDGTLEAKTLKIGGKSDSEKPAKKSKEADATSDSAASPSPSPKK